jgi:hypothetical protein
MIDSKDRAGRVSEETIAAALINPPARMRNSLLLHLIVFQTADNHEKTHRR